MRLQVIHCFVAMGLLLANPAQAGCDFSTGQYIEELADIASVRRIEFTANNNRKWVRNGLQLITSSGEQIAKRHKKKHSSKITVYYDFGTCIYDATVRQNGDFKDHVQLSRGRLLQSLNVKLKEGNIANAVKFKLFLKETRNSNSEILGTLLLSRLGFLAPRTRIVEVIQNGTRVDMLWQEAVRKEFLEYNNRREGPLFEGDEEILSHWSQKSGYSMEDLGLTRLINQKWASRGPASVAMSSDAFSRLQKSYASFGNIHSIDPSKALTGLQMPLTRNAAARSQWWDYAAVMFAMRASHGLRPHNRKFYWNAILQAFEPIYYDGEVDVERSKPRYLRPRDQDLYFNEFTAQSLGKLRDSVLTLDEDEFAQRYFVLCGPGCSADTARAFLARVAENLADLSAQLDHRPTPTTRDPFPAFTQRFWAKIPAGNLLTYTGFNWSSGAAEVEVCSKDSCIEQTRPLSFMLQAMTGMKTTDNVPEVAVAVIGKSVADYETVEVPEWGLAIRHSSGAQVMADFDNKLLRLVQATPKDRFLMYEGQLDGLEIAFEGQPPEPENADEQRFNAFGLTGCVTFYDVSFHNTKISALNGGCEDSVNVIRSSGKIASIHISGAESDALDVDFSNLEIDHVSITNAGNDCLDVSGGIYTFIFVSAQGCGDKAVSVGEASQVEITKLIAENVAIGISSKDSSTVNVRHLWISKSERCYEVYNKKQEFFSAFLGVVDLRCSGSGNFVEQGAVFEGVGAMQ